MAALGSPEARAARARAGPSHTRSGANAVVWMVWGPARLRQRTAPAHGERASLSIVNRTTALWSIWRR